MAERKPRTEEQKNRRKERDAERREEVRQARGFETEVDAQIGLSKILGEQGPTLDSEAEGVG